MPEAPTGPESSFYPEDEDAWPKAAPGVSEGVFGKALSEAKLEVRKKRLDEEIARAQAERDADLAIEQEYYKDVLEVAKGSIDRTRGAAETVQKAAGAIITIYTGALALSFSVSERPLPVRGLYAALLLGLAVVLSTAFIAYLPDPEAYDAADLQDANLQDDYDPDQSIPERLTNLFIKWSRESALPRVAWLRASVVALGFGLVFLPAPFISGQETMISPRTTTWPTPDPASGKSIQLQKILYQAQVDQAAKTDDAGTEITYDGWWMSGFIVVLILVGVIPQLISGSEEAAAAGYRRRDPSAPHDPRAFLPPPPDVIYGIWLPVDT